MPTGRRAREPRSTGTATRRAVSVAESEKISRNREAKALISPQAAKQTANERVARARWRVLAAVSDVLAVTRILSPAKGDRLPPRTG
jgi:hypothetical protein